MYLKLIFFNSVNFKVFLAANILFKIIILYILEQFLFTEVYIVESHIHRLFSPHLWVLIAQLYPTLNDPMDCSPPGSSVPGTSQARILDWVAFPSPGDLPDPRMEPVSPALQADSLHCEPPGKPHTYT